ncbi:cytochrome P460 family protein [Spirochaeta lutea]|nr:cytochrome P460 family protein [Spirochaeta lutea]
MNHNKGMKMGTPEVRTILAIFVLVILLVAGCSQGEQVQLISPDYRNWNQTTDTVLDFTIPGHGSGLRKIYISSAASGVTTQEVNGRLFYDYPQGTQIVKEVYASAQPGADEEPAMLTVMIKDRDHPMQRGGWIWLVKNYQSEVETILDEEFCFTCHNNANEPNPYNDGNTSGQFRDFVFYPYR